MGFGWLDCTFSHILVVTVGRIPHKKAQVAVFYLFCGFTSLHRSDHTSGGRPHRVHGPGGCRQGAGDQGGPRVPARRGEALFAAGTPLLICQYIPPLVVGRPPYLLEEGGGIPDPPPSRSSKPGPPPHQRPPCAPTIGWSDRNFWRCSSEISWNRRPHPST